MSVTIVKPKLKEISKFDAAQIVLPETIDNFAKLKAKLNKKEAKIAPLQKEVAALEKGIIGAVDEIVDAGVAIDLVGVESELKLGKQGERTELTDAKLAFDLLGEDLFFKLVAIKVTDLKAYLTPDQIEEITTKERKIKRRIKIEAL